MANDDNFGGLFGIGKPKVEPNAEMRGVATSLFQIYTGFVEAGFEPTQALQLVIAFIAKG